MQFFLPGGEHFVAIDNMACFPVCSLVLGDGTLAVFVYNHPSHVRAPRSGIEMWVSADGALWRRRSLTTPDDGDAAHANAAIGMNADGQLIVIAGRFRMDPQQEPIARRWMPPVIRLSADDGHTWQTLGQLPAPRADHSFTPFGRMLLLPDGQLALSAYASAPPDAAPSTNTAMLLRSGDGGRTWTDLAILEAENHNETGLLQLTDGRLLAAARTLDCPFPDCQGGLAQFLGGRLDLFGSDDGGRTWHQRGILTFPGQHPGNLIQLRDGRVLLTYGSRLPGALGIQARISTDGGTCWSDPIILVNGLRSLDSGYPSTFELEDGRLVTVYYTSSALWHDRYHMGALRYRLDA